ncbi:MAG: hypothetical protein E3J52_02965 [Promethearchaeota archaeon]|nr:MAG: hypothetical protein E3J52_02965 [Candidatus Lokiarchaeota archaeon]
MQEKKKIVYLYGFSHTIDAKFDILLEIIQEHSQLNVDMVIIFLHDGVIGTSKRTLTNDKLRKLLNLPISVYALIPDIKARGMDPKTLNDKVKGIGYDQLVDILVGSEKIVSWM